MGVNKEKGDGKVSVVVELGSWKLSWKALNLYMSVSPTTLTFFLQQFILIRSHLFVIHIMLSTTILEICFPFHVILSFCDLHYHSFSSSFKMAVIIIPRECNSSARVLGLFSRDHQFESYRPHSY